MFETLGLTVFQFHCAVACVVRKKHSLAFKSKVHMRLNEPPIKLQPHWLASKPLYKDVYPAFCILLRPLGLKVKRYGYVSRYGDVSKRHFKDEKGNQAWHCGSKKGHIMLIHTHMWHIIKSETWLKIKWTIISNMSWMVYLDNYWYEVPNIEPPLHRRDWKT